MRSPILSTSISVAAVSLCFFGGPSSSDQPPIEKKEHDALLTCEHTGSMITSLIFAKEDNLLFSGHLDGRIRAWQFQKGKVKPIASQLVSDCGIKYIATPDNGESIAFAETIGKSVLFCSLRDNSFRPSTEAIRHFAWIGAIAYSRDGAYFASTNSNESSVLIKDCRQSELKTTRLVGHTEPVSLVLFSQTGKTVYTASLDESIRSWDISQFELPKAEAIEIKDKGAFIGLGESLNGKDLFIACHFQFGFRIEVRKYVVSANKQTIVMQCPSMNDEKYREVVFSSDAATMITGGSEGTICYWDLKTQKLLKTWKSLCRTIRALTMTRDGRFVVAGDVSGRLLVIALPIQK